MNQKVTKNILIDRIYNKSEYEKQVIQSVIDDFLIELKVALECGDSIELRGFGTFEPRLRKGRSVARNPKTGETLSVEPHYIAAFRAGQSLKENLWSLKNETKNK